MPTKIVDYFCAVFISERIIRIVLINICGAKQKTRVFAKLNSDIDLKKCL